VRIYKTYGNDAARVISDNPYRLALLREQFFMLHINEHAALAALPKMLAKGEAQPQRAYDIVRAVHGHTMSDSIGPYQVEQRLVAGEKTRWIAIRARGADWSYLTPVETADLGRQWVEQFGDKNDDNKA
jgi:hypothetical protein